jgi:hypothetical protein
MILNLLALVPFGDIVGSMVHQYDERYVAFIDILGFSSLVKRADADSSLLERLTSVLEEVSKMYSTIGPSMDTLDANDPQSLWRNMFRMSTFSDNILISTNTNPIGLGLITMLSASMCNRLLHQGIFTRGAISKEKLIHSDAIVLGAGLIKAYKLEKTAAIYPRILIDETVRQDMGAVAQGTNPDLRRQDFDGLWHLHILHPAILDLNAHTSKSEYPALNQDYMAFGRQEIENALRLADDPSVKAKIGWLVRYFNEYAVSFGLPKIQAME